MKWPTLSNWRVNAISLNTYAVVADGDDGFRYVAQFQRSPGRPDSGGVEKLTKRALDEPKHGTTPLRRIQIGSQQGLWFSSKVFEQVKAGIVERFVETKKAAEEEAQSEKKDMRVWIKDRCALVQAYADDGAYYTAAGILDSLTKEVKAHAEKNALALEELLSKSA